MSICYTIVLSYRTVDECIFGLVKRRSYCIYNYSKTKSILHCGTTNPTDRI
jgi:hypothetical protein